MIAGKAVFIKAVPDNKNGKDGYYCSLVESKRVNGASRHRTILSFGFIPTGNLPYLRAAFSEDPAAVLSKEIEKLRD